MQFPPHFAHRHVGRTPRAIPKGAVTHLGLKDRFHPLDEGLLAHPIQHRGNPELPDPSVRLRYLHPFHGVGPIRPVPELAVQEVQVIPLARCKDRNGDLVDPCTPTVLLHFLPGALSVLPAEHLVNQRVDFLLTLSSPRCCVGAARSAVSSVLVLGLSPRELSNCSRTYSLRRRVSHCSTAQGLPPPPGLLGTLAPLHTAAVRGVVLGPRS